MAEELKMAEFFQGAKRKKFRTRTNSVRGKLRSAAKEYKQHVARRLAAVTSVLQKVAMGDFSEYIEVPEKEDEFTECSVAVNLMIDDLREMMKEIKQKTADLEKAKVRLEEEVAKRTKELQHKVLELERFNRFAVGRELRMVELKEEVARLKKKSEEEEKPLKYKTHD